jgi:hypothetical protein
MTTRIITTIVQLALVAGTIWIAVSFIPRKDK